jgi:hypothetical protein
VGSGGRSANRLAGCAGENRRRALDRRRYQGVQNLAANQAEIAWKIDHPGRKVADRGPANGLAWRTRS